MIIIFVLNITTQRDLQKGERCPNQFQSNISSSALVVTKIIKFRAHITIIDRMTRSGIFSSNVVTLNKVIENLMSLFGI